MSSEERSFFSSQKIWAVLLVADSFFVILFGGALAATLYEHWQAPQPPATVAARRPRPEAAKTQTPQTPAAKPGQTMTAPAPKKTAAQPTKSAQASSSSPQKARIVIFKLKASHAKSVTLVGGFLIHQGGKEAMIRRAKGLWSLKLYLVPGTYRYHFLVNGKKKLDPANSEQKGGSSVLNVSSQ